MERLNKLANEDTNIDRCIKEKLLRQLLKWFKTEFFSWTNEPKCGFCGSQTKNVGADRPNQEEKTYLASVVEIYQCTMCQNMVNIKYKN